MNIEKKTVLLVEDEVLIAMAQERELKMLGMMLNWFFLEKKRLTLHVINQMGTSLI
jgi:sulfur transfer complex TusBCD TusB component (DsrH family)